MAYGQQEALQGPSLQEVVVTAQKRSQDAQKVPISLSVLTGATIQRDGLRDVSDLAHLVPGLSVERTGPGENTVILRGVSSQAGIASTIGYYYGEVPVSQLRQLDLPLFDLARIEVLRGPQGTLYGSSSMGGTIKYVPNQPELTHFDMKLNLDAEHIDDSSGFGHKIDAAINLPLINDKLAARVLVFSDSTKGYIDRYLITPDNYLGVDATQPPYRDVNSSRFYGYQLQLKYQPWDNVTILSSFLSEKDEADGIFTVDLPQADLAAGQLLQARDSPEPHAYDANIANLTINASFGPVDLVSSTSYFKETVIEQEDLSKTDVILIGGDTGTPVVPMPIYTYDQPRELVQEVRLSNRAGGAFQGTIGLYFDRAYHPWHVSQSFPFNSQWVAAYGNPIAHFGTGYEFYNTLFLGRSSSENKERSIFGQGTYHITDKLSATVGLRVSHYDVSGGSDNVGALNGPETVFFARDTFKGTSPKYNVTYQVTPDAMVYSTVAKGLRTGSIESPLPDACAADLAQLGISKSPTGYDPDSLWSYEIGAKTREFNRRMTLNGSVYYIDWSAIQQVVQMECGFPFTANFGKARVKGAELEAQLLPIDALSLYASLGYTNAKLTSTTPGTQGVAGEPLLDVPQWTASVSGEYLQPLTDNVNGFLRVEGSYNDKVYREFVPSFFQVVPAYYLVNLRFGARQAESKWGVTAYVTNLLNKFAQSGLRLSDSGADLPDTRPVAIVQPRTFGLEFEWRLR